MTTVKFHFEWDTGEREWQESERGERSKKRLCQVGQPRVYLFSEVDCCLFTVL